MFADLSRVSMFLESDRYAATKVRTPAAVYPAAASSTVPAAIHFFAGVRSINSMETYGEPLSPARHRLHVAIRSSQILIVVPLAIFTLVFVVVVVVRRIQVHGIQEHAGNFCVDLSENVPRAAQGGFGGL